HSASTSAMRPMRIPSAVCSWASSRSRMARNISLSSSFAIRHELHEIGKSATATQDHQWYRDDGDDERDDQDGDKEDICEPAVGVLVQIVLVVHDDEERRERDR